MLRLAGWLASSKASVYNFVAEDELRKRKREKERCGLKEVKNALKLLRKSSKRFTFSHLWSTHLPT